MLALLAGVCGWGAGRITRQSGADGSASPPSREAKMPDRAARLKALASTPAGGWMERARKATPAELEALWGETETLFQAAGGVQEMAKRWLLTLWAAQDWDGAVNFLLEKGRDVDFATLGQALVEIDPGRALELLNAQDGAAVNAKDFFRRAAAEA